jgi:hypothetical protein
VYAVQVVPSREYSVVAAWLPPSTVRVTRGRVAYQPDEPSGAAGATVAEVLGTASAAESVKSSTVRVPSETRLSPKLMAVVPAGTAGVVHAAGA